MKPWLHLAFQENVNSLLPVFEGFLKNAPNDASYDAVRQSVVVLMGSLAKHLDKSDPKVKPIVAKLITALSTPSQQVPAPWGLTVGRQWDARDGAGCQGPKGPVLCKDLSPLLEYSLVYSQEHPQMELFCYFALVHLLHSFNFSVHFLTVFFAFSINLALGIQRFKKKSGCLLLSFSLCLLHASVGF